MQSRIWARVKEEIAILRVGLLPGMVILGFVIAVRALGYFQALEWLAFDSFLRLRPSESIDERVVIVGINEADIRSVGAYPIPDREIASLLRTLQIYKPRAIGLDIVRDLPVEPSHEQLVAAFKASKNLIAIEKVLPEKIAPPPDLPPEQIGFSDAIRDADGHLRRNLLGTPTSTGYKFSLSLRLVEAYLATEGITLENGINDQNAMRFGKTEIPRFLPNYGGYVGADAGGVQVLINFRSGQKRFRTLSLNDIKTRNFNSNWLRDRLVLIGITSPGIDMVNSSAISGVNPGTGLAYGVEIQAHAVSQILNAVKENRPLLKVWSDIWEYLWLFGWSITGIILGRLTQSPLRNILSIVIASVGLVGISCISLTWGLWLPVVPAIFVLVCNGVILAAFYQYYQALQSQIKERQVIIERIFDTIHNGPLQTLARLLRSIREQDLPTDQLILELEHLNHELRVIYDSVKKENISQEASLYLGEGQEVNLQSPTHEILYEVYSKTLERDFPCFKTLKVKVRTFDPIDPRHLSIEQKRGLCRFLEEALCNVGKYATGVTRLKVICTQNDGWYTLSITDNGLGSCSESAGRGTKQSKDLARQLKGKFQRSPLSNHGTLCELTWPIPNRMTRR